MWRSVSSFWLRGSAARARSRSGLSCRFDHWFCGGSGSIQKPGGSKAAIIELVASGSAPVGAAMTNRSPADPRGSASGALWRASSGAVVVATRREATLSQVRRSACIASGGMATRNAAIGPAGSLLEVRDRSDDQHRPFVTELASPLG